MVISLIIVSIVIVAMVINNKMARCYLGSKAVGFYTNFVEIPDDSLKGQYCEVEKIVDRRITRGKPIGGKLFFLYLATLMQGYVYYLVLWKWYRKEEATWVKSKDVTEHAIKYKYKIPIKNNYNFMKIGYIKNRHVQNYG